MLKKVVVGITALLLICSMSQATILLEQGYGIGALNGGSVDGIGVATGGSVIDIDNMQTATNIDCGKIEVGVQKQNGILVQGGTAIGTNPDSSASFIQGAGAASGQLLLAANEPSDPIVLGQRTTLVMGQGVVASKGAAANAGQGAVLANGQAAGTNNGTASNGSVIGAVNTSSAIAGPCSTVMSDNAVNMESFQTAVVN